MLRTLSVSGNTLCAILGGTYKGLLQLCVVINPIMQIFFLFFDMVLSKYGLDCLFYGIFSIDWILLLIFRNVILGSFWVMGLGCHPSHTQNSKFQTRYSILLIASYTFTLYNDFQVSHPSHAQNNKFQTRSGIRFASPNTLASNLLF